MCKKNNDSIFGFLISLTNSMSVYHSIRGSMQPGTVDEDVEDQDGLVVVDLNAEPEQQMATIHPAERISGQVIIKIKRIRYIFFFSLFFYSN